jgi:hypothetical protein
MLSNPTPPTIVTSFPSLSTDDPVGSVLNHILQVINATFFNAGVPLPERQYLTVGVPMVDCEQLVVAWETLQRGLPRTTGAASELAIIEGKNCTVPRTVTTRVYLTRCWPTGTGTRGPDPADLNMAVHRSTIDAWLLYDACMASDSWGLGSTVTITANEPTGGYQTILAELSLAVP